MNTEEKAEAAARLVALRATLDSLRFSFADIISLAKQQNEASLAFSALMIQESIESFTSELSSFVVKKISED